MNRHPPSPLSDEELEKMIPSFRRRKAIIDRRWLDLADFKTLLVLRPTWDGEIPLPLTGVGWKSTSVEDRLVRCFWCRADGWLGVGQVERPDTRNICLCCQATMMAMGIIPSDERNQTYLLADPDVPKRLPPAGRSSPSM